MDTKTQYDGSKLKETVHSEVAKYQSRASKERVSVKDSANTRWFIYDGDVAIIGLMLKPKNVARIKGVWVSPEYRGQGIGTSLTEAIIEIAKAADVKTLEVYAHNPTFYEQRGFKVIGKNQFNVPLLSKKI